MPTVENWPFVSIVKKKFNGGEDRRVRESERVREYERTKVRERGRGRRCPN